MPFFHPTVKIFQGDRTIGTMDKTRLARVFATSKAVG